METLKEYLKSSYGCRDIRIFGADATLEGYNVKFMVIRKDDEYNSETFVSHLELLDFVYDRWSF